MNRWYVLVPGGIALFAAGCLCTLFFIARSGGSPPTTSTPQREWGEFPRTPKAELLTDSRRLKLLEDFAYVDPRGRTWFAPKGWDVDGASIPRDFWGVVGGPLEGEYRDASIIHDVACDRRTERWEDVHLAFYEACRCRHLPENKAKLLYAAVYHFGPHWREPKRLVKRDVYGPDKMHRVVEEVMSAPAEDVWVPPGPGEKGAIEWKTFIDQDNPSLEAIEQRKPSPP